MSIQWFPGHMAKTRRIIEKELAMVDVVIELVDARLPKTSKNPLLEEIVGKKRPHLIVMTKADLADPGRTAHWLQTYRKKGFGALALDLSRGGKQAAAALSEAIYDLSAKKRERFLGKGAKKVRVHAMIIGIPNVGKSTLINAVIGRSVADTGNKPGVTRGKQWLRLSEDIELLDTPGILWPKFDDDEIGYRLAISGAVSDDVFVPEEAAFRLVRHLKTHYPEALASRYALDSDLIAEEEPYALMQAIGRRRGALISGGRVDDRKTSVLLLKEFRNGAIGRISLE
ncbi:ribosome biogenesis GTPase YlqF [Peptococcus simiae]|uniref:ribosome biogenesis GTPase YlqF n=1 Tax=Peptococcus simiae TaxID=1643805 RepID=UPI00397F1DD7